MFVNKLVYAVNKWTTQNKRSLKKLSSEQMNNWDLDEMEKTLASEQVNNSDLERIETKLS